ncbi:hypothetical protein BKE38_19895 [Pseudoroseomonas deserti]|uniref:Glycosyltransferase 61 catalytic domain-containing protein n=1 Tax=Teichococcus deserti TaxID=1817963 RepID=A0A1V2GZA1_9PROT|nr:glycosyltransferase family 61 protein [Pseudoroseomonas deserti]ONG50012.1 hypothetical protein BKE38_19895 [Pseudoroseomonas deserti]
MPSDPPTPPAPRDPALALEIAAGMLARRGDWPKLVVRVMAALPSLAPETVRPRTWLHLVTAALETGSEPALQAAIAAGLSPALPPETRIELARRLAIGDRAAAGLAVLLADPALMQTPALAGKCLMALKVIGGPRQSPALQACLPVLRRVLLGEQKPATPPPEAPFAFPAPALPRHPATPLGILNPEAVPAADLADIRGQDAAFAERMGRARRPRVRLYEDVFVNRRGQIWRADGTMLDGGGRLLDPACRAAEAKARFVPEAVNALEASGFFHWFAEWMPSLFWTLQCGARGLPYLLGDRAPDYQAALLGLLRGAAPETIAVGDAVRVGRLYAASRETAGLVHWGAYQAGFERLAAQAAPGGHKLLYLSRRDAPKRAMGNEAALEARLARAGFHCVPFSGLSLPQQIGLVQDAALVVAPHGAGLAHLLGQRRGIAVLELMPVLSSAIPLRHCFARISALRGHRHAQYLVRPNAATQAWSVDVGAVAEAAERMAAEALRRQQAA